MQLVSAMNPSDDPKFKTMGRLDAALENRFLVIWFPNIAKATGASLWLPKPDEKCHDEFLHRLSKNIEQYTGINAEEVYGGLKEDWMSVYTFITDSKKMEKNQLHSALEFDDLASIVLAGGLDKSLEAENRISEDWAKRLGGKYGSNFGYSKTISKNNDTDRADTIAKTLREDLFARDQVYVKKIADSIKIIREIKGSFSKEDPLQAYLDLQKREGNNVRNAVTIEDVACGYLFLTRSKSTNREVNAMPLVNQLVDAYVALEQAFDKAQDIPSKNAFSSTDITRGIKNRAFSQAINYSIRTSKAQQEKAGNPEKAGYAELLINYLDDEIGRIKGIANSTSPTYSTLFMGRCIADLSTLAGFIDQYKDEINSKVATSYKGSGKATEVKAIIKGVYDSKIMDKNNVAFPEIYEQRLPRIFG
jgi:hypothetical protein